LQDKPAVLAAFPPSVMPTVSRLLAPVAELAAAMDLDQACLLLEDRPDLSLVACGVHFDDSRMFQLLAHVRRRSPRLPFLCCRFLGFELPNLSRESMRVAATSLGASGFLDYPTLVEELGEAAAAERCRSIVLAHLDR
jgi:hypothetical protein